MKWLLATLALLFSCAAFAADDPSQAQMKPLAPRPQTGVVVVDGKKFFPLQNARRFNGSNLSPSALSVMHHPRAPGPIVTRGTHSTPANTPTASPASSASTSVSTEKPAPNDVLSVFAPEDKTAPPDTATK